ncbi:MAG: hypothetical protein ACRCS6_10635 [Turicibacter sp.]
MNLKQTLTLNDFHSMFELEKLYYDAEHITPADQSYLWYKMRPHSIMAVEDDYQIVGFMCLFPIPEHIVSAISQGMYNDADMTYEDIMGEQDLQIGQSYTLFLSCIVIHSEYRKTLALSLLLNEYKTYYQSLTDKGILFDHVLSDNITQAGLRFSKRMGLSPLIQSDHDSTIVKGSYQKFITSIKDIGN